MGISEATDPDLMIDRTVNRENLVQVQVFRVVQVLKSDDMTIWRYLLNSSTLDKMTRRHERNSSNQGFEEGKDSTICSREKIAGVE